jgi:UDP-N-acetylmuramoyl-tripeptide--D-alanyl-D-alanine ligase
MFFTWQELAEITGGRWQGLNYATADGVGSITDDSRTISPGCLFIAVKGERVDGHRFVQSAAAAGVAAVCVDADWHGSRSTGHDSLPAVPCLVLSDTLKAFHRIAAAHRHRHAATPVLAITGSSGKTSVRTMTAAILEHRFAGRVLATEGNTNNFFGVPRNVLRLAPEHRVAVLELGSNHPGEIAVLADIIDADIGVITSIGAAHLEFFKDLGGVAAEKGSLLSHLRLGGRCVVPADTPYCGRLRDLAGPREVVTFGQAAAADVQFRYLGPVDSGYAITLSAPRFGLTAELTWPIGGVHQASNAAAAAAAAMLAGARTEDVVAGLKDCRLPGMRMQVTKRGGIHWVNDAYNANPDSVRAAVLWFGELTRAVPARQKVIVLGDMLELGARSSEEHRQILAWILEKLPAQSVLCVGAGMQAAAGPLGVRAVSNASAAVGELQTMLAEESWVLLKGSRGIQLEKVIEGVAAGLNPENAAQ